MNRRQLDTGMRCNKSNFTYALDQQVINNKLMKNLLAAKPTIDSRANPHFLRSRLSRSDNNTEQSRNGTSSPKKKHASFH